MGILAKFINILERKEQLVCGKIIFVIGVLIFSVILFITSIFTTKIISYSSAAMHIYLAPLEIIGALLLLLLISNKITTDFVAKFSINKLTRFAFVYGFVASLVWVLIANVDTMWDSRSIVDAAFLLNGTPNQNSFIKWSHGDYMEHFPYQAPMVFLIFLCMKFTGSNYLITFQIINCLAVAAIMYAIVRLTSFYSNSKRVISISFLLTVLFLPIIFYSTFVYGDLIGFALMLSGWLFFVKYISIINTDSQNSQTKHKNYNWVPYAVISITLCSFAVILKSTMLIGVVAMIITLILNNIKVGGRLPSTVVIITVLIGLPIVLTMPLNLYLSNIIGFNPHIGVPKLAWITMGIGGGQEYMSDLSHDKELSGEVNTPAGYFDNFIWASKDNGGYYGVYSEEYINSLSKEYLKKRLEHYRNDPLLAVKFFADKLVVEWSEPTYESLLASNWSNVDNTGYSMGSRSHTYLAKSIYYGKLNAVIRAIMSFMQIVLPFGVLMYLLLHAAKRKSQLVINIPLICIFGFFIFYLFWENKTQYMWPSFVLMIPMAAVGIACVRNKCELWLQKELPKMRGRIAG